MMMVNAQYVKDLSFENPNAPQSLSQQSGEPNIQIAIDVNADQIADKAFDSNWIIEDMNERGAQIVVSQRPQRSAPLEIDQEIYKWRHLIENFFCKLKEFKRIAMRSDKTDQSFEAMIYASAAIINSR